ncbi:hypothetical protein [Streptomyces nitrosporeus]|uniref:hypothetical protein n=1 Tax=Streptomyces nitrosporeus TaxID=28894 RepID=UPI0039A3A9D0
MADESSTQPQAGMAALRARKGAKKTAAATQGTKVSEAPVETARRTPPPPKFPKASAAEGSSGTGDAGVAPAEQNGGRSVAQAAAEQQPVSMPAAASEVTSVKGADAGRQGGTTSEPKEAPAQEQMEHGRGDEAAAVVTAASAAEGEALPVDKPDAGDVSTQGGGSPSSPDIPVQARTPEAEQALKSSDGDRVAGAQEEAAAVPPRAEAAQPAAAESATGHQAADEAAADGTRSDSGEVPGAALERRSAQAPVAVTSQWDRHVPPPVNEGFPRAEEILNQRFITREALNASVPAELQIPHRLQLLKVVSRINHIPPADLVAVAVDWFLRGGKASADDMLPPWNRYTGHGTPEDIRPAEVVLNERFITRESLKSQVPRDLQLNHRLAMYRVLNRLEKMPPADIVTVALDRWLRVMRF